MLLKPHVDVSENNGTPKSSHFNRVFHNKPSIWGYPYFWKHPHVSNTSYHFQPSRAITSSNQFIRSWRVKAPKSELKASPGALFKSSKTHLSHAKQQTRPYPPVKETCSWKFHLFPIGNRSWKNFPYCYLSTPGRLLSIWIPVFQSHEFFRGELLNSGGGFNPCDKKSSS